MSATIAGVPRVKPRKLIKAKPLEPTAKRPDPKKKKARNSFDDLDDLDNSWRTR